MPKITPPVPGMADQDELEQGLDSVLEMVVLRPGDAGNAVRIIQNRLAALGYHTGLVDGDYGTVTQKSVMAFQRAHYLKPTGLIDNITLNAMGFEVDQAPSPPSAGGISAEVALRLFPDAPEQNVRTYLPLVLRALMALATIRAETAAFAPISEYQSKYNTAPGGQPYGLYDFRSDLGNNAVGDGNRYKGRGFIQLTGKYNYKIYSQKLGLGNLLLDKPELANDPMIAARLLACFLKSKESAIRHALAKGDFASARKAVNGGSHGLAQFTLAFQAGADMIGIA
jgi:peptidoglycan hydrolase-like protein with peptidoglycan-binding domain